MGKKGHSGLLKKCGVNDHSNSVWVQFCQVLFQVCYSTVVSLRLAANLTGRRVLDGPLKICWFLHCHLEKRQTVVVLDKELCQR